MNTNSKNKGSKIVHSAKQSAGKASTQSTLSFGAQGKLNLQAATASVKSDDSKKRSLQEINENGDTVIVVDDVSPIDGKKKKLNDGSSQLATSAFIQKPTDNIPSDKQSTTTSSGQKGEQAKDEKSKVISSSSKRNVCMDEEVKENICQNLPPKNLEKLKGPSHPSFDPIEDAPYYKGQPIPFSFLARALSEIEVCKGPSSQDTKKEIIANVFRTSILLNPKELPELFYFFCVKLAPDYEGLETGIGHELLLKSVAKACGKSPKQIRENFQKEGDLGVVVQLGKSTQNTLGSFFSKKDTTAKPALSFRTVFEAFKKIGKSSGNNSVQEKENIIVKLLLDATNEEAKYIVRWLSKTLKTGAAEKTFISALARAIAYTPPNRSFTNGKKQYGDSKFFEKCNNIEFYINEAICEFPNYGEIINTLLQIGDDMLELKNRCYIRVGIPVKPMLAKPTKGVREVLDRFEQVKFTCEYKYDGFRGQIHFDRANTQSMVQIYSRNLEKMTGQYPDVVEFVKQSVKEGVNNFILDSELVAYDTVNDRILPFQILTQRSRKNVTEEDLKTKICICAFDLLYLNGESLLKDTFLTRRDLLHKNFQETAHSFVFAKYKNAEAFEEIEDFLNESVKDSCEGLMIKTLEVNASYEPSKRSLNWLKLKKDYIDTGFGDSLDLVVVGADWGKGKRAGIFGSFLLACYNEDLEQLQTVTKMATGISDELMQKIFNQLKDLVIDKPPANLKFKEKNVDVWLLPTYVWEIKCADLSISPVYCASIGSVESNKGIALRFPRFIRERDDKQVENATTSDQILDFFRSQPQMLAKEGDDEDYDF